MILLDKKPRSPEGKYSSLSSGLMRIFLEMISRWIVVVGLAGSPLPANAVRRARFSRSGYFFAENRINDGR